MRDQGKLTMRKLLDASMIAFARRGFHSTRVNDIVEIADTSHGTFYLYFSNKEDLLRALVAEAAAEAGALSPLPVGPGGSSTPASYKDMLEWVRRFSSLWQRYAPILRSWTDLASVDSEAGEEAKKLIDKLVAGFARRIASTQGSSSVDSTAAGMAIVAMLDRFHTLRDIAGKPIDEKALDTLTTMVYRAAFASAS